MNLTCAKCGSQFKVGGAKGGAKVVCPGCNAMLTIPGGAPELFQFQDKSGGGRRKAAELPVSAAKSGRVQASSFNKLATASGALVALAAIGLFAGLVVDDRSLAGQQGDRTDVQIIAASSGDGGDATSKRNDQGASTKDQSNSKTNGGDTELPPFEPLPPFSNTQNGGDKDAGNKESAGGIKPSTGGAKKDKNKGSSGGANQKGKTTGGRLPGKQGGVFTVDFLGTKGKGKRFAIVADNSGSMIAGKIYWDYKLKRIVKGKQTSLQYLQGELIRTLHKFNDEAQFFVVFYSDGATRQPQKTWVRRKKDVNTLVDWVKKIRPQGQTKPLEALRMVFNLEPKPDVIFFMSDGIIPKDTYKYILALNAKLGKKRITVNTIQFNVPGTDEASQLMAENTDEKGKVDPNFRQAIDGLIQNHMNNFQKVLAEQRYQFGQMNYIAEQTGGVFKLFNSLK